MSKNRVGVTSALFTCHDCDWSSDDDLAHATARARAHAKKFGHFVSGEVSTAYHYDGKNMK